MTTKGQTGFTGGLDLGRDVQIIPGAGAPTDGTTGRNEAGRGSIYLDRTNGNAYVNFGSLSNPRWMKLGGGLNAGAPSRAILRTTGVVASGETFTIGTDVFRIAVVNTDSTKNTTGAMAVENTTDNFAMTAHGLIVGDLIRVENEIMRVLAVRGVNSLYLQRGVAGTTIATHVTASDIYTEASPGSGSGKINLGFVGTLTAAQLWTVLADDIADASQNIGFVNAGTNVGLFYTAVSPGGVAAPSTATLATTETMTNAAFDAANMVAGNLGVTAIQSRVPTAAEVTEGAMYFVFPSAPTVVGAHAYVTATPGLSKAALGAITVTGNVVKVDNAGATDWAATDTVVVTVLL